MGEISKAVGQWIVANVGWSIIILLFVLSCFFKIAKIEIDPLSWVFGWIGKALTQNISKDLASFREDTQAKFDEVKADRAEKIKELKQDYNDKISDLRNDLDTFEVNTNRNIDELRINTKTNHETFKQRLDDMEKSNDMQTVRQIKIHVLNFANSCMNGVKHTVKDFRNIIKENEEYETLVAKYNLVNDVYTDDFAYIMEIYRKCKKDRSFLMDNGQPFDDDDLDSK